MRLEFLCPHDGDLALREVFDAESAAALPETVPCAGGGAAHPVRAERLSKDGGLLGCLVCGHQELYTQKDFPRALGFVIVGVAAVLAPFTYYLSLVAAGLVDAVIYVLASDVVVCYVCHARHVRFAKEPRHPRFDREIDERLRYGERAVMGKPMREGGTAGAPEPEH